MQFYYYHLIFGNFYISRLAKQQRKASKTKHTSPQRDLASQS